MGELLMKWVQEKERMTQNENWRQKYHTFKGLGIGFARHHVNSAYHSEILVKISHSRISIYLYMQCFRKYHWKNDCSIFSGSKIILACSWLLLYIVHLKLSSLWVSEINFTLICTWDGIDVGEELLYKANIHLILSRANWLSYWVVFTSLLFDMKIKSKLFEYTL